MGIIIDGAITGSPFRYPVNGIGLSLDDLTLANGDNDSSTAYDVYVLHDLLVNDLVNNSRTVH